jgi:hypothetical protein
MAILEMTTLVMPQPAATRDLPTNSSFSVKMGTPAQRQRQVHKKEKGKDQQPVPTVQRKEKRELRHMLYICVRTIIFCSKRASQQNSLML